MDLLESLGLFIKPHLAASYKTTILSFCVFSQITPPENGVRRNMMNKVVGLRLGEPSSLLRGGGSH